MRSESEQNRGNKELLGLWKNGEDSLSLFRKPNGQLRTYLKIEGKEIKIPISLIHAGFPINVTSYYFSSKAMVERVSPGVFTISLYGGPHDTGEFKPIRVCSSRAKVSDEERFQRMLLSEIEMAQENAESAKGKEIVAILGPTGVGKSVLVNQLLGVKLKREGNKIVAAVPGQEIARIGHRSTVSETTLASLLTVKGKPNIVDCGGFFDTRGLLTELKLTTSIMLTLQAAASVKLVFCIPFGKIEDDRAGPFLQLLSLVLEQFLSNSTHAERSLLVLFTKPPKNSETSTVDRVDAIERLQEVKKDLEPHSKSLILINFLLREEGKYIAVYDPLNPLSVVDVEKRIQELAPIEKTNSAFSISYSPQAMGKLAAKAFTAIARRKEVLVSYDNAKERDRELAEEIEDNSKMIKSVDLLLSRCKVTSDKISELASQVILSQTEELIRALAAVAVYKSNLKEITTHLDQLVAAKRSLDIRKNEESLFAAGGHTITNRKMVYWYSSETGFSRYKLIGNAAWSNPIQSADKKQFSVSVTPPRNVPTHVRVELYCKVGTLPEFISEYNQLLEAMRSAEEVKARLFNDLNGAERAIIAAQAAIEKASQELREFDQYKKLEKAIVELNYKRSSLLYSQQLSRQRVVLERRRLEGFLSENFLLEGLLNSCRIEEVQGSPILADYLASLTEIRNLIGN